MVLGTYRLKLIDWSTWRWRRAFWRTLAGMGAGAALTGSMTRALPDWTAGSALGAGFSAVRRANFGVGSAARGKWLKGTGAGGEAGAGRWAFTGSMGAGRDTCGAAFAGPLAGFAAAAGALVWWLGFAGGKPEATAVPAWQLLVGGFFVGYGARLGNGCTSGHGICGLGSLQWPSLMAVLTFMATAFLTANLFARWLA